MNGRFVAAAFLLVVPSALGQPATLELIDPTDDLAYPNNIPASAGWTDLKALRMFEDLVGDAIIFEFELANDLPPFAPNEGRSLGYQTWLTLGNQNRRVDVQIKEGDGHWRATCSYVQPLDDATYTAEPIAPCTATISGRHIRAIAPRQMFEDAATVQVGTWMRDMWFTSFNSEGGFRVGEEQHGTNQATDRVPDEGSIDHEITYHTESLPDLLMFSNQMVKASNGGATTLVFPVRLIGNATGVSLSTTDAPAEWDVDLPIQHVAQVNGEIVVPLVLTARFEHRHGVSETLWVEAVTSQGTARAPYGIHYLEYPQPAGHHPRLFVYALNNGPQTLGATGGTATNDASHRGIMTARSDHPNAEPEPLPANQGSTTAEGPWTWAIPLDPALKIGVHPSMEFDGSVSLSLSRAAGGEVELSAQVGVADDSGFTPLWETAAIMSKIGEHVELPLSALVDEAVPFVEGTNLEFRLLATGATPAGAGPDNMLNLVPGTVVDLPLREYHDPILGLVPETNLTFLGDDRQISIQPGSTTIHHVALRNLGEATLNVHVLSQASDGVSVLVQRPNMTIAGADGSDVSIVVEAPADGTFPIALAATSDQGDIAIGRLLFDVRDDAPLGEPFVERRDSPGLGWVGPILALLAIRRRHP